MSKIPFNVYDFFAYLSSGSVVIGAIDYLFGYQWLLSKDISIQFFFFLIFLSYTCGHCVAHFSSFLLEKFLVKKLLRSPTSLLMGKPGRKFLKSIFPGYHQPLPKKTQKRIVGVAKSKGIDARGSGFFEHAYSIMSRDERVQGKLDQFRNLYAFARNMSFSLFCTSIMFLIANFQKDSVGYSWIIFSLVLSLVLLYRYLKFFRQYTFDLLVKYSEMEVELKANGGLTG